MTLENNLVNYKVTGQGSPVLLLHGLFGNKENLGAIARPLSETYQVISVDLRNHGKSFHADIMDYPSMSRDIVQLLDHLHIDTTIVIGHSMGGKVAMQLALSAPERVSKLVVMDIAPIRYTLHHQAIMAGLKALDERVLESRHQADEILARYEPDPPTRQFLLTNLKRDEHKKLYFCLNISGIINNQDAIAAALTGNAFTGLTLFIRGSNSDYVPDSAFNTIKTLFPNYQLESIAGAGHMVHAEQPLQVNTVIKNFLHTTNSP